MFLGPAFIIVGVIRGSAIDASLSKDGNQMPPSFLFTGTTAPAFIYTPRPLPSLACLLSVLVGDSFVDGDQRSSLVPALETYPIPPAVTLMAKLCCYSLQNPHAALSYTTSTSLSPSTSCLIFIIPNPTKSPVLKTPLPSAALCCGPRHKGRALWVRVRFP